MATAPDTPDSAPPIPETPEAKRQQVKEWMLEGEDNFTIRQSVAAWPGFNLDEVINSICDEFEGAGSESPELLRGFCIAGMKDQLRRANAIGDGAAAQRALKTLHDWSRGED